LLYIWILLSEGFLVNVSEKIRTYNLQQEAAALLMGTSSQIFLCFLV